MDKKNTNGICISSEYHELKNILSTFSLNSFNMPSEVSRYKDALSISGLFSDLAVDKQSNNHDDLKRTVTASSQDKPFEPDYADLCRLHFLTLTRKPINLLEFGSGYSTMVFANAMQLLNQSFGDFSRDNFRADEHFHVYSIEEEQRFLDITQARLSDELKPHVSLSRSSVELIEYDHRFATVYTKLPNIAPDLIYLDGPSQFATTSEINGFSMANQCRMPMSADILRFEFFLEPGTLILVDGRTANARFLKAYLKRNWAYFFDDIGDVHYFELQEAPLGKINATKLQFCLNNEWLIK